MAKKETAPVKAPAAKRPPQAPAMPAQAIQEAIENLTRVKDNLETYAAHLRTLDRRRLQSIGIKKEGFAQRAYHLAMNNPEFLPNYLPKGRYAEDHDRYMQIQTAVDLGNEVRELLVNIGTEDMDYFYTDGLDFYASVREAAKRRVDPAETIHAELFAFFRKKKSRNVPEAPKEQPDGIKGDKKG